MKKLLLAAVIVLALALGASIYFCVTLTQDKNVLADELASVQDALVSTQAELTTTKDTLTTSQTELSGIKATLTSTLTKLSDTSETLASTQSELDTTSQQLTSKLTELNSANNQITSLQEDMVTLQDSLSDSNEQLAIVEETLDGLGITIATSAECEDVALIDNPQAQNPTWQELMSFLAEDRTDKNDYIEDVYDCSQFSRDVHNNAEAAGIRAAEVQVGFKYETTGHALNAFLTTDYGLIYVDCTEEPDKIARIKTRKEYRAVKINRVTETNIRNDDWWDALSSYYYFLSDVSPPYFQVRGAHSVTSSIEIYW